LAGQATQKQQQLRFFSRPGKKYLLVIEKKITFTMSEHLNKQ